MDTIKFYYKHRLMLRTIVETHVRTIRFATRMSLMYAALVRE